MKSHWLIQNQVMIEQMRHRLTEYELMGAYDEIPLREIIGIINGAENEIRRMNSELVETINKYEEKIKEMSNPVTPAPAKKQRKP